VSSVAAVAGRLRRFKLLYFRAVRACHWDNSGLTPTLPEAGLGKRSRRGRPDLLPWTGAAPLFPATPVDPLHLACAVGWKLMIVVAVLHGTLSRNACIGACRDDLLRLADGTPSECPSLPTRSRLARALRDLRSLCWLSLRLADSGLKLATEDPCRRAKKEPRTSR
jgi:hypothetical protein